MKKRLDIKTEKIRNKKAYFFSLDALIALAIIVSIVLLVNPISRRHESKIDLQEDIISVLSSIKIGELDSVYAKQLISEGKIINLNQSILEQIGEFYAAESPETNLLAQDFLNSIDIGDNSGIWFNNELIASKNSSPIENASRIWTSRQIISGIEKGENVKGYSARAFLSRASRIKYFYFGGYVGDGNITSAMSYSGVLKSVEIEATFNKDFDLYVNDNLINHYASSDVLTPIKINLTSYISYFNPGTNYLGFRANNLYTAGGFIKIVYDDSDPFSLPTRHSFPGIEGVINIYDSFYIPSTPDSMEVFLHYKSDYNLFLKIGSSFVLNELNHGEITKTIPDSELRSLLDYQSLGGKTIPVRLGLSELGEIVRRGNADVVLITDLSGSMNFRMNSDNSGTSRNCSNPNLYDSSTSRISLAKCLDKQVVDIILNASGNRLALSAFYGDENEPYKGRVYEEALTQNSDYLKSRINLYQPQGGTCICCSINDAYKILNTQSNSSRIKFIIVMSDGIPTHTCQAASGCEGTRTGLQSDEGLWLGWGAGCYGGLDDCNVNDCECASQNANWSSCRAYNNLNATVYSIGFGPVSTCWMANKTLRAIAQCGHGKYYTSDNATILQEFYSQISQEILHLSYIEQISEIIGLLNKTILYPDSYISFSYNKTLPYGLAITLETDEFGNTISQGALDIPSDSEVLEANAISYSGPRWTDNVSIYNSTLWKQIFNLQDYGSDYIVLGDPYVINIPIENIAKGSNLVKISTSIGPGNYSGGSPSDKIIYSLLKEVASYSPIVSRAQGCIWNIEFEDGTTSQMRLPETYTGNDECYYTNAVVSYDPNDAINSAIYNLFLILDLNKNNKIETKFSEQNLVIDSIEISGIPFTWSSEVQARVWR